MLSFSKFVELLEALKPRPGPAGPGTGFEELHNVGTHNGSDYHVGVNILHLGGGHHKVIATFGRADESGSISRHNMEDVPPSIRQKAVFAAHKSVKEFKEKNDWKSLSLGGTDKDNKKLYRNVGAKWAAESAGKITAHDIPGAGVKLVKTGSVTMPSRKEVEVDPKDPMNKHRRGGIKGKSDASSGGSKGPSAEIKSDPFKGKFGLFGSKGPIKADTTSAAKSGKSEKKGAKDSGASFEILGSSGESSAGS